MSRLAYSLMAAGLLLGACGTKGAGSGDNGSANASAAANHQTAAQANPPATPAQGDQAAPPPTLSSTGLGSGLAFGTPQAKAVAAAVKAFGAPTARQHSDECGQGAMDFVNFHDLSLEFEGGRFAGWSLGGGKPPLRTAGGLAIGAPRSALGGAAIDRESTLGPEFEVGGIGGLLDDKESRIATLWAGSICQFR